jgi:predicted SAM-dependent methyltransferase
MKLNMGGGKDLIDGYITVDKFKTDNAIQHNLNEYPYPFKDNSVEEIKAFHIIEHLDNYELFFAEILRILKPQGKFHIKVPHFTSAGAFSEYHTHTGYWYSCFTNKRMFRQTNLERSNNILDKFNETKRHINFEMIYPWNWIINFLMYLPFLPQIYDTTFLHSLFPAKEIEIILIKSY